MTWWRAPVIRWEETQPEGHVAASQLRGTVLFCTSAVLDVNECAFSEWVRFCEGHFLSEYPLRNVYFYSSPFFNIYIKTFAFIKEFRTGSHSLLTKIKQIKRKTSIRLCYRHLASKTLQFLCSTLVLRIYCILSTTGSISKVAEHPPLEHLPRWTLLCAVTASAQCSSTYTQKSLIGFDRPGRI